MSETPMTDRETYTVKAADIGFKVVPVSCSAQIERKLGAALRALRYCYEKLQPLVSFEEWLDGIGK